jgi:hypothetical protein
VYTDVYAMRVERNGYWGYPCPYVYSILDVPDDQGGYVTVKWNGTRLDEYPNEIVTHYSVWRSLDGPTALAMLARDVPEVDLSMIGPDFEGPAVRRASLGGASYWWEWVANMEAHYLDNYAITAPTLNDWMQTDDHMHYFFLSAHTSDPFNFWDSPPDSGYSKDNLAPCTPMALAGEQSFSPVGLDLSWDPNTEIDLSHYNIYRGTSDDFVPGPGNLLTCTPDTVAFDDGWTWDGGYYYKVSALDIHGNESPFALLGPDGVTGEETPAVPLATYLEQNYPNPFNPSTSIAFGIDAAAKVVLRIYDARGRLVRILIEEEREAGVYNEVWNGRDGRGRPVSSGVYFYRLDAGAFTETRKMVLLR